MFAAAIGVGLSCTLDSDDNQPHTPYFSDVVGTCPYSSCSGGIPGTDGSDVGYWEY